MKSSCNLSDVRWEKLLSSLSPNKLNALEKSLKDYQQKYNPEKTMDTDSTTSITFLLKSEPMLNDTPLFTTHKTKNRGLTYENGRRNLKLESCSYEEKERRAKRRERNRVAAAKCREKRQNQLDQLHQQVNILKQTESQLQSELNELKDEESQLKAKLLRHNCIVTEDANGELSLIVPTISHHNQNIPCESARYHTNSSCSNIEIQRFGSLMSGNNNNNRSNTNKNTNQPVTCRPQSLPISCQNSVFSSIDVSNIENNDLEQVEFDPLNESLTPLMSPDTYNLLKCQIKSEPNDTETPNKPTLPIMTAVTMNSMVSLPTATSVININSNTHNITTNIQNLPQNIITLSNPMINDSNCISYQMDTNKMEMSDNHPLAASQKHHNQHQQQLQQHQLQSEIFSWNSNEVDHLSHNCFESSQSITSSNYLTTPTVDVPCYSTNSQHFY